MRAKLLNEENGQKTFAVVFNTGDEVVQGLTTFARATGIAGAQLTAIGAFSQVTLGYFDLEKKGYKQIPLQEQVEVVSLVGNIGLSEGKPKVHAHVVVGRSDGSAYGGHLLEGKVRPTLEVMVVESPKHLQRRMDQNTGLALIDLAA